MKNQSKGLHPRNIHNERYDFNALIESCPELAAYVRENSYGDLSIDFSKADAVIALNRSLLKHFYKIDHWELPKGHLCAPVPGRVDYVHYIADLLASCNNDVIPKGNMLKGLDVGTGANCIYPLIGNSVYGWKFVGVDIDSNSINSARNIIKANPILKKNIKCRFQNDRSKIFENVIKDEELFDFTICNPPFHSSAEEAMKGAHQKARNLHAASVKMGNSKRDKPLQSDLSLLNFGGKNGELWCPGGELAFIKEMVAESVSYKKHCLWFTTLVSKKDNLEELYLVLKNHEVLELRTVEMQHGQKLSRFIAWTFLTKQEQSAWAKAKWKKH